MLPNEICSEPKLEFDLQRRVVAHMTSVSWKNVPHVSYVYEPDITDFYEAYREIAEAGEHSAVRISLNTVLLKLIVEGIKSAPVLNSHIEYHSGSASGSIRVCSEINVTMPWLLADGRMITPVVRNAGKKTLNEIAEAVADLERRIKNTNINEMLYQAVISDTKRELKKLNLGILPRVFSSLLGKEPLNGLKGDIKKAYYQIPESDRLTERDIVSGTVTISNIGSLYREQRGMMALLEIVPPQIFAVGLGSIQEKPGICIHENGSREIGIRKHLPVCLAFDHRAVDFSSLVPFMKRCDEFFTHPEILFHL